MAYNKGMFDKSMKVLRKNNKDVVDWLLVEEKPKHMWVRHPYHPICKSDRVTNNVCEDLNALVRWKVMLSILQSFICRLMVIFKKKI